MLPLSYFSTFRMFALCALLFGTFSFLSCQPVSSQAQAATYASLPSRDSLRQQLRTIRKLTIIYPGASPVAASYASWAETLSRNSRYLDVSISSDQDLSDSLATGRPLLLIGNVADFPLLKQWEKSLPLSLTNTSFTFQGTTWDQADQLLFLSWYPHPETPHIPISVITGNSDEHLLASLEEFTSQNGFRFGFANWDYQVTEGNRKRLIGNYQQNWTPDPEVRWEFDPDQRPASESPVVKLYYHEVEQDDIGQVVADTIRARKARFSSWIGHPISSEPLEYHLYGHPETMGLDLGEMETGLRKRGGIHRIVYPGFLKADPGLEIEVWMEEAVGQPSLQILMDGLRAWSTPSFLGPGFRSLGASLLRAEGNVPISVMLDDKAYIRESPLVRDCYAGLFVDFLIDHLGKDGYLMAYEDDSHISSLPNLSEAWETYQDSMKQSVQIVDQRAAYTGYHKGMTFAHEGYQVYNGYGSRGAEKALQGLADLGCNTVAIVPYTGTGNPRSSQPLRWSRGAGGENDASVVLSHYGAASAGMKTMLKPQVWVRGGWPGDVDMATEEEWEEWFDSYHRWIRHYAVLAEIHQMDILCLGTEFRYATMKHPDRWRDLIRRMREIYHGEITYAANWGEETDNLGFADALDFVGVNFYYPLSERKSPSDEELAERLNERLSELDLLAESWGKPYVLTEIGYRSIDTPWLHPHADVGDADIDQTAQARCYQAVLSNLKNHPTCRGLYWWKWPSHDQYSHRVPGSFTACEKEAEEILRQAYQAW